MKDFVLKYWFAFPLVVLAVLIGLIPLLTTAPSVLDYIAGAMFLLVIGCLAVSWVVLLANKRWWQCAVSFISSAIIVVVLGLILSFVAMSAPDGFARDHKIPEGLELQLPLDAYSDCKVVIDSLDTSTYLQIWNGDQGGIYKYDFYSNSLPDGEVFLRCYEFTSNTPLSEDIVREQSTVPVSSFNTFSQVVNHRDFTIYEGDWEDYYAARIEVWFRDSNSKQERKLCEKLYRVEGWMR